MVSPTLSVIIPTYDRRLMVMEAVDSILRAAGDVEVVVVDDGSTDGTADLLRARYGDEVTVIVQPNMGRSAARNRGVAASTGDYVAFLDSDDVWEPWHATQFRQAVSLHGTERLYSASVTLWDPEAGILRPVPGRSPFRVPNLRAAALVGTVLPMQGLFVPRALFGSVGGFDVELRGSEDWELLVRLVRATPVVRMPKPSVRVRSHPARSMADVDWDVEWRRVATDLIITKERLTAAEVRLVQAATARYCAARFYEVGRMQEARRELRNARSLTGVVDGWRATAMLTAQTHAGHLVPIARAARQAFGRRRLRSG